MGAAKLLLRLKLRIPRFKKSQDFKNDEFKQCTRQRKCDGKNELDEEVMDFIIFEKLLYKEDPAPNKENYLKVKNICHNITAFKPIFSRYDINYK